MKERVKTMYNVKLPDNLDINECPHKTVEKKLGNCFKVFGYDFRNFGRKKEKNGQKKLKMIIMRIKVRVNKWALN